MSFFNETAQIFYKEITDKKIVEKNENVKSRLVEVIDWKNAFETILKHKNHFRLNIIHKEQLLPILKRYGFKLETI